MTNTPPKLLLPATEKPTGDRHENDLEQHRQKLSFPFIGKATSENRKKTLPEVTEQ